MPCYSPLTGYRSRSVNASGKRSIVFSPHQGFRDMPVKLPCGQCIGCRLERSRQWAIRCVHEAQLYDRNSFITLTYSDENLPKDASLNVEDWQKFMKRLRKRYGKGVKYFHCGEYGEQFGRPHYHAILFNLDFSDKELLCRRKDGDLYVSESLERLWTLGHSSIGDVTFESAAYVARYVTKKITGKNALHHYNKIDLQTGEILAERRPEYQTSSKAEAIGRAWLEKYMTDVYPDDFVVLRGKKLKPPRYYNSRYELAYPSEYASLRAARTQAAKNPKHEANNTWERLAVREHIQKEKAKLLLRSLK